MMSATRFVALSALFWIHSSQVFAIQAPLTNEAVSGGSLHQDEKENETLVARWCADQLGSEYPRVIEVLSEQNRFVEDLLSAHRERVAGEKARYEKNKEEYLAAKGALLDRMVSELESFLDDQRKAGDPREIMDSIQQMILLLGNGDNFPMALNPLEKRKRKDGKRTVTVEGKKEKIETVVFDGHEYALTPGLSNWLDARRWCEERGGYLACIETREELDFIGREMIGLEDPASPRLDAMQPHRLNFWVGASDSRNNGSWLWLSGSPVDISMFHRKGIPAQPSDFSWGEHHGGVVVYRHPERGEPEIGLIDWNLASRSRAVCEWGRTPLPRPWSILTEAEVEEFLVPIWKDLQKVESDFEALREKLEIGSKHRRPVEAFHRSVVKRREDLGKQLKRLRSDSVKVGRNLYTIVLKDLISGLELGGLDCSAPLLTWERPETACRFVGRAFGKSYLVINEPMTFHDAEEVCRELGGQLPSPKSWLEMDLLLYVLGLEESIPETWLAIAHHSTGPRNGWRSPEGVLGEHSPGWMRDLLGGVEAPHQTDLYAFALVQRLTDNGGSAEEDPNPSEPYIFDSPEPYTLNSQNRRPFICVAEDFQELD